jgi:ABC-type Zn uptake system ZnuABC Zn-binding protein ZnuA
MHLMRALSLLLLLTSACNTKTTTTPAKPRVAVSIFPLYDLARRVAGDRLDVVLVLPPGRSEHSYDPTPKEMARVADAKLGISVGLQMDEWLEKIVKGAAGSSVKLVQLGPQVNPRKMTHDEVGDEAADEARPAGEEEHHHGPLDPHFWLDPVRTMQAVDLIVTAFTQLDPEGAAGYRQRGDAVKASIQSLHQSIEARVKTWTHKTLVTFHGSMGYYAERYGLTIAAVIEPFPGREPTAKYITEVLAAVKKTNTVALFSEPQLEKRPAQVIADQAHVKLFELDPVGGTTGVDSYEKLLQHNTDVLEQALR